MIWQKYKTAIIQPKIKYIMSFDFINKSIENFIGNPTDQIIYSLAMQIFVQEML